MEELAPWLGITPIAYPVLPGSLFFLPVVATSLAIALVVQRRRRPRTSLRDLLFPASIYRTTDFRVDLGFFLLNRTFYPILVALWVFQAWDAVAPLIAALEAHGLTRPQLEWGTGPLVLFTVSIFLSRDFGTFLGHWLHHRIPVLWEFHKVHHTTRALNPFSAFRAHPVEDLAVNGVAELIAAPVLVGFVWAYGDGVGPWTLLGVHGFVLVFRLAGYHLRHSHVWLSFGPVLGRILISPAHHQIHHSRAPEHWDRNMGKVLAIWDGLFGTLYVPGAAAEPIEYGISEEEDALYDSVPRLYLMPFRRCFDLLSQRIGRRRAEATRPASPEPAT